MSEHDDTSDLTPITRWARRLDRQDAVITFNYDTLVERALSELGKAWSHGFERERENGIPVFKLHGSIDWIVAHRRERFSKLDPLFDKENLNRLDQNTGNVEDDYCLWRCRSPAQRRKWIEGRDLQCVPNGAGPRTVGIAGLGAYKELHQMPGLGHIWTLGMQALYQAHCAVVVGFAMSDFDAMAQLQFAEVARARRREGRPLPVIVVDPHADEAALQDRFHRVFRTVDFVATAHEDFNWSELS